MVRSNDAISGSSSIMRMRSVTLVNHRRNGALVLVAQERTAGDPLLDRRMAHRRGDRFGNPRVEDAWYDVLGVALVSDERGDGARGRELHAVGDPARSHV